MSGPTLQTRAPPTASAPDEATLKDERFPKLDARTDQQRSAGGTQQDVTTATASALKENGLKLCEELLKTGLLSPVFNKKYAEVVQKARAAFEAGESEKGYAALSYVSVLSRIENVYSSFDQAKKENFAFLSNEKGLLHDYLKACLDPAANPEAIKRLKPAADMVVSALEFLSQVPDSEEFLSTRTLVKDALRGLSTIDASLPEDKLQGRLDNAQMRLRCAAAFMEAQKLGFTLETGQFEPAVGEFFALYSSTIRAAIDAVKTGDIKAADSALNRASLIEEPLSTVISLSQELKITPAGNHHDSLQAALRHFVDSKTILQKTFSQMTESSFAGSWKELTDYIGRGKELLDAAHKTDVTGRYLALRTNPALEALRSSKAFILLSSCIDGMHESPPSLPEGMDAAMVESILQVFETIGNEKNPDARRAYENALNAYAEKDTARGNLWYLHGRELSSIPALAVDTEALKRGAAGGAWDGYKIRKGMLDNYATLYAQFRDHTTAVEAALTSGDLETAASELRKTDASRTQVAGMHRCLGLLPSVSGAESKETAADQAFRQYSRGSATEALITLGTARSDITLEAFSEFLADGESISLPDGKTRTRESITGEGLIRAKAARENFDLAQSYMDGPHKSRLISQMYVQRAESNLGLAEGTSQACGMLGVLARAYGSLNNAEAALRREWGNRGADTLQSLASLRAGAKDQHAVLIEAADAFNDGRTCEGTSLLAQADPLLISRVSMAGSAAQGLITRDALIKSAAANAEAARKDPYLVKTDQAHGRNDRAWMQAQFEQVGSAATVAGGEFKTVISKCAQVSGGQNPVEALTEIRKTLSAQWQQLSGAQSNNTALMYCLRAMEAEAVVSSKADETLAENSGMLRSVDCSPKLKSLMQNELDQSNKAAAAARKAALNHMDQIRGAGTAIRVQRSSDGKIHIPEASESPGYASLKTATTLSGEVSQVVKVAHQVSKGAAEIELIYQTAKTDPTLGWRGGSQRLNTMMTGVYGKSAYRRRTAAMNDTLARLAGAKTLDGYLKTYNELVPQAQSLKTEYQTLCSQCATALTAYDNAGTLADPASPAARASAKQAIGAALNGQDEKYRKLMGITAQRVENIMIDQAHLNPESALPGYRAYLQSVGAGTATPVSAQNINAMLEDAGSGNAAAVNARNDAAAWFTLTGGAGTALELMSNAARLERNAELSQIYKSTAMESGQLVCIGASFVPIPVVSMIGRAGLLAFSTYSILNSERNMIMDGKMNLTDMTNIGVNLALAGVVSPFRFGAGAGTSLALLSEGAGALTGAELAGQAAMQGTNLLFSGAVAVDMGMNISERLKSGEIDLRLAVDVGLLALSLGHFTGTSARMAGFDARVVRGEADINFGQFKGRINVGRVEVQTPFTGAEWVPLGAAGLFTGAPSYAFAWQVPKGPLHVYQRGGQAPAETRTGRAPSPAPQLSAGSTAAPSAAGLARSLGVQSKAPPSAGVPAASGNAATPGAAVASKAPGSSERQAVESVPAQPRRVTAQAGALVRGMTNISYVPKGNWQKTPELENADLDDSFESSMADAAWVSELARWMMENPPPAEDSEVLMRTKPDGKTEFRWATQSEADIHDAVNKVLMQAANGEHFVSSLAKALLGIKDPALRGEVAVELAKRDARTAEALAMNLKDLEITDAAARYRLAMECVKQGQGAAEDVLRGWRDFEIEDPPGTIVVEAAKWGGEVIGRIIANDIKDFRIKDPSIRAQLVLRCAQLGAGYNLLRSYADFKINDPAVCNQVLLQCASTADVRTAMAIADNILNLNVRDPAVREEIFRLIAERGLAQALVVLRKAGNFRLYNPAEEAIAIARTGSDGAVAVAWNLDNLGIRNPADLERVKAEIAKQGEEPRMLLEDMAEKPDAQQAQVAANTGEQPSAADTGQDRATDTTQRSSDPELARSYLGERDASRQLYAGQQRILLEMETASGEALVRALIRYEKMIDYLVNRLQGMGPSVRTLQEAFFVMRDELAVQYGLGRNGFMVESTQNGQFDCDNSALVVYDLAKRLGMDPEVVVILQREFCRIGDRYYETTDGTPAAEEVVRILNDSAGDTPFLPGHALLRIGNEYFEATSGEILGEGELEEIYAHSHILDNGDTSLLHAVTTVEVGQVYYAKGNWERALDYYYHALRICPDYPSANRQIAMVSEEHEMYREAAEAWRSVVEAAPDAVAWKRLGRTLSRLGEHDEAKKAYQEAEKILPTQDGYHDHAIAPQHKGRPEEPARAPMPAADSIARNAAPARAAAQRDGETAASSNAASDEAPPSSGLLTRLIREVQTPEVYMPGELSAEGECFANFRIAVKIFGNPDPVRRRISMNAMGERDRLEVSKMAVCMGNPFDARNFSITGRNSVREIRRFEKTAARIKSSPDRAWLLTEWPDEGARFELARIMLLTDAEGFQVSDYGLQNQQYIERLADLAAEPCPDVVIGQLARLVESSAARISLARKIARDNPEALVGHAELFGFQAETDLVSAVEAAENWERLTYIEIQEYSSEIHDQFKDYFALGKGPGPNPADDNQLANCFRHVDERTRLQMAKVAAVFTGLDVRPGMFGITLRSHIEELEKCQTAAERLKAGEHEFLLSEFPDERDRVELARLMLARGEFGRLEDYGIRDQKALYSLAEECIAHKHTAGFDQIMPLIESEEARFELAREAASGTPFFISDRAESFRLSPSPLWADILSRTRDVPGHLFLNLPEEKDRVRLAEVRLEKYGARDRLSDYQITDQDALERLCGLRDAALRIMTERNVAFRIPGGIADHSKRLDIPVEEMIGDLLCNFPDGAEGTLSGAIMNIGEMSPELFGDPALADMAPYQRYSRLCQIAADTLASRGEVFPPVIAEAFASEAQGEKESAAILAWLIENRNSLPADLSPVELSRHALKGITGYAPFERRNTGNTADVYRDLLSLSETFGNPAGKISIADECWGKQLYGQTQHALSLIKALKGMSGDEWDSSRTFSLNAESLPQLTTEMEEAVSDRFAELVGLEGGAARDKVMRLSEEWGFDLSPLMILAGRYSERDDWAAEVGVVREICENVLNGTFLQDKYDSEAGREQLSMMTPEQIERWKENPTSMKYLEPGRNAPTGPADGGLSKAVDIMTTNLIPHAQDAGFEDNGRRISESGETIADQVKKLDKPSRGAAIIFSIADAVKERNLRHALALCTYFIDNSAKFTDNKAVREDIKGIRQAIDPGKTVSGKGYLLFSAITDDPRIMLMIGDMVESVSCQNYRTGHFIQTLPGYCVDANIKAQLTWAIPSWQLSQNPAILECLRQSPENVKTDFDAGSLKLTLTLEGTDERLEIRLDKAFRRHIIRAGADSSQNAVMVTERGYVQNHAVEEDIRKESEALINAFEKKCGFAPPGGTVRFPGSKNPGGVYSDLGGGIKQGPYAITIE